MMSTDHTLVKADYYFPTIIFSHTFSDAPLLNRELLATIRQRRLSDTTGIRRSNIDGWHSRNELHRDPSFSEITRLIRSVCDAISDELGYDRNYRLGIDAMWAIVNGPGHYNSSHIHPCSLWSGVYYVQAPDGAGDIEFTDPRTANLMASPEFAPGKNRPQQCWRTVSYTPNPGKLLIFPSWLYHSVETNKSAEVGDAGERVIISFNISQHRR